MVLYPFYISQTGVVLQALILAAGMGNRLGKYTKNNTKCMVEVGGKTLIQRMIKILKRCGIKKIVIVVGYMSDGLISHLKDIEGVDIEFVFNKEYERTNNIYSLYLARDHLLTDDTLLLESDIIFDDIIINHLMELEGDLAIVDRYAYWMDGTAVVVDENNVITEFVEKKDLVLDKYDEYHKTVNIYKLTKKFSEKYFVPETKRYIEKNGRGAYYELVLKVLSDRSGPQLKAVHINRGERWYEIDDPRDLAVARTMFSENDTILSYTERYGGFWRFPYILDFCYLVNPYFPPKFMMEEMSSMLEELVTSYPSGMDVQCLNAGVSFGINKKNILVGNGAAELINELDGCVGKTVGVCVPTFEEYIRCFRNSEIRKIDVSDTDYIMDEKIIMKTLDDVDTFVIVSPNNPCGDLLGKEKMIMILERAKEKGKKVIFDESFIDFADDPYTLIDQNILDRYPGLIVIKSISKSYGVPGVRLGILATSDRTLLEDIRERTSVWNINSFGEFFLQTIGKYASQYKEGCDHIRAERKRFMEHLSFIPGLKVYPSNANYFMCRLETATAADVTEKLLGEYGILIKDLTKKSGIHDDRHIRIAIRDEKDNDRLVGALSEVLTGRKHSH